jgi:hypothetical protein
MVLDGRPILVYGLGMSTYDTIQLEFVDIHDVSHFPNRTCETMAEARAKMREFAKNPSEFNRWAESPEAHLRVYVINIRADGRWIDSAKVAWAKG